MKKPKVAFAGTYKKEPRTSGQDTTLQIPSWRLNRIDFDGPWCPGGMSRECLRSILARLAAFEGMTWPQIISGTGSHPIEVSQICKEAQKRLEKIKLDDTDDLFSLRLNNRERLWGIRHGNVFQALWWDPEHQVYPVEPRNT